MKKFQIALCAGLAAMLLLAVVGVARGERLSVKTSTANVRNGPGDQYEVIWQVGKYHPLEIIQKAGVWYRFRDSDRDEGWIHSSVLDDTHTVVTIKENCPVYTSPDHKSKVMFTAEKGVPFKIVKGKGVWIQVQHEDGDKGWIHKSLVW
jgi:SH3-like domain-containing protein